MGSPPLVAAKLAAPVPPAAFVDRERLYRILDRGLDADLTLVVGPAGAGKSALVAGWTASRDAELARAWVNADPGDTSSRLLRHVARAVAGPGNRPAEGTRAGVRAALRQVRGRRLVVVIDDVQALRSRHAVDELGALATETPPHVHLVLVSRSDPHLRATWRAGAEVVEVRGADLRLTDDEVGEIVAAHRGLDVDAASVAALTRKVDGWAAGLQLALAALVRSDDPAEMVAAFGGSTPVVAEYLLDEVLGQLDRAERDALLDLSVLDDLSAEACHRTTGREDAHALLAGLADRNLLIERYTDGTFRCHPLLQQLLQLRLRQGDEDRFTRLHRAAAELAEEQGDLSAAVEHHLAADDAPAVVSLCRRHAAELVASGGGPLLHDWLGRLPEHRLAALGDQVDVAELLLRSGDVIGCALRLERCRAMAGSDPEARRRIDRLQGVCHHRLGDPEAALRCARQAGPSGGGPVPSPDVAGSEAFGLLWRGDLAEARRALATAPEDDPAILGLAARVEVEAGDLPSAQRLVALALAGDAPDEARLHAWAAGAQLLVETMVEGDADDAVEVLIAEARRLGARDVGVVGLILRARMRWSQICLSAGLGALVRGGDLFLDRPLGALLRARLDRWEVRLLVEAGEIEAAHELLDRVPGGSATAALRCRAWAAEGEVDRALEWLAVLRETDAASVDVALAWARVLADVGDRRASAAVGQLLRQPATRHRRRTYLEEGERLRAVLRATGREGAALADVLDRARQRTDATVLSSRELAVLQFLPTRLTNQEIGAQLFVSANTVKTHLKNLYRRLGVGSRDEAVARARELGLLPPGGGVRAPVGDRSPAPAGSARGR